MPRTPSASALAKICSQSTGAGMRLSSAATPRGVRVDHLVERLDVEAGRTRSRRSVQRVTGKRPQLVLERDRRLRRGLETSPSPGPMSDSAMRASA